jgi:hypothetical protein
VPSGTFKTLVRAQPYQSRGRILATIMILGVAIVPLFTDYIFATAAPANS